MYDSVLMSFLMCRIRLLDTAALGYYLLLADDATHLGQYHSVCCFRLSNTLDCCHPHFGNEGMTLCLLETQEA